MAGQPAAAFAAYREGMRLGGAPEEALKRAQADYQADGLTGFYRGWLDRQVRSGGTPMSDTARAKIYARVGEKDSAIESLQKALEKRESALAWVNVDPSFQPLRSDARFQQIAQKVEKPLPQ
jgi:tetratricopeptide (TPR) repeat protein